MLKGGTAKRHSFQRGQIVELGRAKGGKGTRFDRNGSEIGTIPDGKGSRLASAKTIRANNHRLDRSNTIQIKLVESTETIVQNHQRPCVLQFEVPTDGEGAIGEETERLKRR